VRLVAALVALALVATTARATPGSDLDKGRAAYRSQDYDSAFATLNSLLYPNIELARQEDIWEAYVLLGASAYHRGNRQRAIEEFEKALAIELDRTITTNTHKADVVQLYEDTKARLKDKLEREAERKKAQERERQIRDYLDTIGVYEVNRFGLNFVPFGAGQFQNKQRTKGYILAGAQVLTGATSLGIFIYLAGTYGLEAKVPLADAPRVQRLQQIEVGAGLGFFALYIYGVIDGMVNFKSSRLVKGDDSLVPTDFIDKKKPPPKKTSFRDRLRIGPMLTPNGVGIGLGWEND
jgi:tetratricopeptide (TPR) repeat protein